VKPNSVISFLTMLNGSLPPSKIILVSECYTGPQVGTELWDTNGKDMNLIHNFGRKIRMSIRKTYA
jgi:hypothetical protein